MGPRKNPPLPVATVEVPLFVPTNPLNWACILYRYIFGVAPSRKATVVLNNGLFTVSDEDEMRFLWDNGFFGKGVLSRSEPTWLNRTKRRLNVDTANLKLSSEEVTALRREGRKIFKSKRLELERQEDVLKRSNETDKLAEIQIAKHQLIEESKKITVEQLLKQQAPPLHKREEDVVLLSQDQSRIEKNLEYLQLMPEEVLFLHMLGCIDVVHSGDVLDETTILEKIVGCDVSCSFLVHLAVYYHYRSLGWCVKSGLKFSTDYILYQRGPPFQHAEFAVLVLPTTQDSMTWFDFCSISRVVGGVKKTVVLSFVSAPNEGDIQKLVSEKAPLKEILKLYTVEEVVFRRWVAARNRE